MLRECEEMANQAQDNGGGQPGVVPRRVKQEGGEVKGEEDNQGYQG